jgi:integrase
MKIITLTNEAIINRHLLRYKDSPESIKTRKSSLNYFFVQKYFNFNGHISEISKSILVDYFDWLNQLTSISLSTKQNKWRLLRSLLEFCMEYYDDFLIKIPTKKTIQWKNNHKKPNSNKDIRLEKEEVKDLLTFMKINRFSYYLIFRIFAETGMRKGELINIDYDKVNLKKRFIDTHGKRGQKIYYFSRELGVLLDFYIESRKSKEYDTKALFVSNHSQRFSNRPFNIYLKIITKKIGLNKNITCKTFRSTLNTLRKIMGCSNEDRKILINHKTTDVNVNHYINLKWNEFIELFDNWNPYKDIQI